MFQLMESGLWRPFVQRLDDLGHPKLNAEVIKRLSEAVVGEMTGGDRALISSLEGLEDLQLVGRLQIVQDHGFAEDDLLFAVTEGGETSSVIGSILAASEVKKKNPEASLFFVYNNPDSVLTRLNRSKKVLEHPGITKMRLWTGPQAVTGSTRMQATTIETYICGLILQEAARRMIEVKLEDEADLILNQLGFASKRQPLKAALKNFGLLQEAVAKMADDLATLTDLEANTYAQSVSDSQTNLFADIKTDLFH